MADITKEISAIFTTNAKEVTDQMKDLTSQMRQYKEAIKACEDEQKELDKAFKDGKISAEDYDAKTAVLSKNIKDLSDKSKETKNSLNQLNATNLNDLWNGFKTGIKASKSLTDVVKVARTAFSSLFKMLAANPWGAIATLVGVVLVGAFNKLREMFKKNDDAGTALKRVFEMMKAPMKLVEKLLGSLVDWLGKVANKVADAIKYLSKFIPALNKVVEAQDAIVQGQDAIEEAGRQYSRNHTKREREISELRKKAQDEESYTYEQRKQFLKDASKLEQEDLDEFIKVQNQKINQLKLEAKVNQDTSDEMKDQLTELENARDEAIKERADAERRLNKEIKAIQNKQNADYKAAREEEKRADKEAADAEKQRQKDLLDIQRQTIDAQNNILEDGKKKDEILEDEAYKRRIADLKSQFSAELQETEEFKALLLALENEHGVKMAQIGEKYQKEEDKKKEESLNRAKSLQDANDKARLENLRKIYQENQSYTNAIAVLQEENNQKELERAKKKAELELALSKVKTEEERKAIQESLDLLNQDALDANREYANAVQDLAYEFAKKAVDTAKSIVDATNNVFSSISDAFAQEYEEIMSKEGELSKQEQERAMNAVKAQRDLALAQLALNQAISISNGIVAASKAAAKGSWIEFGIALASITAGIISAITSAKQTIQQADAQIAEVNSRGGQYATGGYIQGAGSSTSDSIPARLSNGEAVINARSTARFYDLLSAINQAGGGVAFPNANNMPIMRYASGGVATSYDSVVGAIRSAVNDIQPVVSVKEITRVQNRVLTKEIL